VRREGEGRNGKIMGAEVFQSAPNRFMELSLSNPWKLLMYANLKI
jgi:hypothetical protein